MPAKILEMTEASWESTETPSQCVVYEWLAACSWALFPTSGNTRADITSPL